MPRELIDRRPVEEVAAVVLPVIGGAEHAPSRLEESQGLAEALGVKLAFSERLNIRDPSPARLFGQGQLDTLSQRMKADHATLFIVDAALTPVQQRNLENELKLKVVDRTGLILEIFGLRARTAEPRPTPRSTRVRERASVPRITRARSTPRMLTFVAADAGALPKNNVRATRRDESIAVRRRFGVRFHFCWIGANLHLSAERGYLAACNSGEKPALLLLGSEQNQRLWYTD